MFTTNQLLKIPPASIPAAKANVTNHGHNTQPINE